jgi:hypothetical protein
MNDSLIDIAADLRDRFEFAIIWFYERSEVMSDGESDPDLSDDDAKAVKLLKALLDTVDAIPPMLIEASETLQATAPDLFERMLGTRCASRRLRICADHCGRNSWKRSTGLLNARWRRRDATRAIIIADCLW